MGVDLMKFDETQEEIKRYSMAAGAGNFDRTAFEYSPEIHLKSPTKNTYSFCYYPAILCKFIASKTGLYKYECALKTTNYLKAIRMQLASIAYPPELQRTTNGYEMVGNNYYNIYISKSVGTIENERLIDQKVNELYYLTKYWDITEKTSVYTTMTQYFTAREGECFTIEGLFNIDSSNVNQTICTFKNQKITY